MLRITAHPRNEKVFQHLRSIPDNMRIALKSANLLIGKHIQRDIRKDMQPPKSGKIYFFAEFWKGKGVVQHQASAPGEAPAVITGSLRASVNYVPSANKFVIGAGTKTSSPQIVGKPRYVNLGGQIGFGKVVNYARKLEEDMNRPYIKSNVELNFRNTRRYYERQIARRVFRSL